MSLRHKINRCFFTCGLMIFVATATADSQRVIDYRYDGAGNIISIQSGRNLGVPEITGLNPPSIKQGCDNTITTTGLNLLHPTVSATDNNLSISNIINLSETAVQFQLSAGAETVVGETPLTFTTRLGSDTANITVQENTNTNSFSLYFDGNDYIIRRNIPLLNAHSIEFWMFLDDTRAHNVGIAGIGPAGGGCGQGSVIRQLSDGRVYQHIDPAGCGGVGASTIITSQIPSAWTHYAGTYDGVNHKVYINGNLVGEDTARYTPSTNFVLGTDAFAFRRGGYMRGSIDEVKVWDHARTQKQILANIRTPLNGDESGLVLYWPMSEGQGQQTADLSASEHTAVFSGQGNSAPTWNEMGALVYCGQ